MKKKLITIIFALFLFFLFSCECIKKPCFEYPDNIPEEIYFQTNEVMVPFMNHQQGIGCVIGIIKDGQRYMLGYGKTKKFFGSCPDEKTFFEIGSITKTLTGLLFANMVYEGIVKLNDPLRLYLPEEVIVPTFQGEEIQLVHLASHTSGLPELPPEKRFLSGCTILNPYACFDTNDLYTFLSTCSLKHRPGEVIEYSTLGIALLAHVLSLKAGISYEELLKQQILYPLKMGNTSISLTQEQSQRFVQGYGTIISILGFPLLTFPMPHINLGALEGGGALVSDLNDMMNYLDAMMNPENTVLNEPIKLSSLPISKIGENDGFGLGWAIHKMPDGKDPLIWHNGQTYSSSSFIGLFRESKIGVVVMNNRDLLVDEVAILLLEKLTGRKVIE